ncbi:flavin reductase family protein [Sphingomonas sp. BK580]|uniref:flavin reductase family protein n=1 Tax=Sphingomonas sp. BK580 TaxID=2586972 RepID=UPI001813C48B|nr:flavin reductase family protein [Sphingomonas sp. BK580]MBB3695169.1 flavin reductase (DIM6/NTAB) family NADH-FMN oxidoreductase RutF [Sphingomonas sp. BK580]
MLVTTCMDGEMNVMTLGFHMMVSHDPPLVAVVLGPWDHSFSALRATGECVISVPPASMAEKVVDIGNCSGADVDKFERFDLTALEASHVSAPLIAECVANVECRVADDRMVDDHSLFILSAEAVWIADDADSQRTLHHRGDGVFAVDGEIVDHHARMTKWRDLPLAGRGLGG